MTKTRSNRRVSVRVARLIGAAALAGVAVVGFTPSADADTTTTIAPTAEAWYQPNPGCSTPAGCVGSGSVPPATPYPSGTLHVGASAGDETARSYLALPLAATTGTITAAALDVPLDLAPADGAFSSDSAKVQVCLTSAPIARVRGSFDQPPSTDCSAAAPATYLPTPQPHLAADLGPLVDRLRSATGLVLLPDATQSTPTESWRVVFVAHDASGAATAPASVMLKLKDESAAASAGPSAVTVGPSSAGLRPVQPALGTSFAVTPPTGTAAAASPKLAAPAGGVRSAPRQIAAAAYAYPGMWLLPLAMLVLVPAMVKAMTADLRRAEVNPIAVDEVRGPAR